MQPFHEFIAEANKDAANPKFQVLVVNCDKREEQYKEHMAHLKEDWYAVPFENGLVAERLEDMAQAAAIPRLAIFNPTKSIDEAQIKDCKSSILRNQSMEQAVREVMDKLS